MAKEAKINIFELADQNAYYLQKQYKIFLDNCNKNKSNIIYKFAKKVQDDWKLSINMKDRALGDLFSTGKYENIYDLKKKQVDELVEINMLDTSEKKKSVRESLKKHLKDFYKLRKVFDSCIADGAKLKYAALNIGGTGVNRYARYCVVISQEKAVNYNTLTFIKGDSLLNYIKDEKKVTLNNLAKDVANKDCIHILAIIKHKDDIGDTPQERWPNMICNDSCYIEAITKDDILSSHIHCIRINKSYYDSIFKDALLKAFNNELTEEEQYRLAFFKHLRTMMKESNIELEIIDEN